MTKAEELKQAAARIKNAAPELYNLFVNSFEGYTLEAMELVTVADATQILAAQGRAQQCRALLRHYQECDKEKPKSSVTQ